MELPLLPLKISLKSIRVISSNLRLFCSIQSGELELSEQQKADFLDFVRSGKGFAGVHSATDTFYQWPEYGRMIGAYFDSHPWNQIVSIRVEDPIHQATAHLGATFQIADEIYRFKDFSRQRVHILMSLDTSSVDLANPKIKRNNGEFSLSWTRRYGQGRVFYSALGHRPEVWDDPRFQKHLFQGVLWTMGDLRNSTK